MTFDQMVATYYEQIAALVDGGVDILLAETAFDTLVLKACLFAIDKFFEEPTACWSSGGWHWQAKSASAGGRLPVMVSVTIFDGGRTLSAQTVEAFWNSIAHAESADRRDQLRARPGDAAAVCRELSQIAPTYLSCYPNAGLPNAFGGFDETPEMMARTLGEFAERAG